MVRACDMRRLFEQGAEDQESAAHAELVELLALKVRAILAASGVHSQDLRVMETMPLTQYLLSRQHGRGLAGAPPPASNTLSTLG